MTHWRKRYEIDAHEWRRKHVNRLFKLYWSGR